MNEAIHRTLTAHHIRKAELTIANYYPCSREAEGRESTVDLLGLAPTLEKLGMRCPLQRQQKPHLLRLLSLASQRRGVCKAW